jgi:hypothetical protein
MAMAMPAMFSIDMLPPFSLHPNPGHHVIPILLDLLSMPVLAVGLKDDDTHRPARAHDVQVRRERHGHVTRAWTRATRARVASPYHANPDHLRSAWYSPRHAEPAGQAGVTFPRPPSPERTLPPAMAAAVHASVRQLYAPPCRAVDARRFAVTS